MGGNILKQLVWGIILVFCFSSCDIKKNKEEVDPSRNFIKIYENNDFSQTFQPLDIAQTADRGFIILAKRKISESPFFGVYILKIDEKGDYVSEQKLSSDYVNPIHNLMKVGSSFYFFVMDRLTLQAKLMVVDDLGNATEVATIADIIYPLYASVDPSTQQFFLQHYNRDDLRTVVSRVAVSGLLTAQREFNIGFGDFDIEEPIIDHMTGVGKKLPFLTGTTASGQYYFNGFYNYTLSLVFFNFSTGVTGVLQGYKDERCISSVQPLSGNTFAVSRYSYGDNFVSPNATIDPNSIASSSNLTGYPLIELNEDANVVLKKVNLAGRNMLLYNSDTKSGQIGLFAYDESGALLGTKYLGYSNRYEAGNFTSTDDGGIAVVGTTYLAGRFPRIVVIKMGSEEVGEMVE